MKHILLILAVIAISATSFGQSSNTRQTAFGVTDASVLSWKTATVVDTGGSTKDSIQIRPNAAFNYYKVNLVDSAILNLKSRATCYYGDQLILDVVAPAFTDKLVFGNYFKIDSGSTSISLTASKSTRIWFEFDGANFVERSRIANYTR